MVYVYPFFPIFFYFILKFSSSQHVHVDTLDIDIILNSASIIYGSGFFSFFLLELN
ncbi:hypothetical protein DFH27DRAFT_557700 [Peziza echinospora]|nr:hypothetical protein DFH27DRAFT_557700 [Peziza echinospora]